MFHANVWRSFESNDLINFQIPQWYELIRTGVCTNWSSEKKQQKESKNGKKKKSNVKTEEEWLQNAFMCKNIWKKIVVA